MLHYLWWIPALVSTIFFMSWLSCKSDESWRWFVYLFLVGGVFQVWPWVARLSKNDEDLIFNAILYDSLAVVAWTLGIMFWSGGKFSVSQWVGAGIVIIGLALIQKG